MLELFKQAFQITKRNYLVLMGLLLSVIVVMIFGNAIASLIGQNSFLGIIANWVLILVRMAVSVLLVKYCLYIIRDIEPSFKEIKPSWNEVYKYLAYTLFSMVIFLLIFMVTISIFSSLGVVRPGLPDLYKTMLTDPNATIEKFTSSEILYGIAAFFLMCIPALLLYLRVQFGTYLILEKNIDIFSAFGKSLKISKGYLFYIVITYLFIILLNIAGILLFGIGLLFTMPMSMVVVALLYKSLDENYVEEIPAE